MSIVELPGLLDQHKGCTLDGLDWMTLILVLVLVLVFVLVLVLVFVLILVLVWALILLSV